MPTDAVAIIWIVKTVTAIWWSAKSQLNFLSLATNFHKKETYNLLLLYNKISIWWKENNQWYKLVYFPQVVFWVEILTRYTIMMNLRTYNGIRIDNSILTLNYTTFSEHTFIFWVIFNAGICFIATWFPFSFSNRKNVWIDIYQPNHAKLKQSVYYILV